MKYCWLIVLVSCARLPAPPLTADLKKENVLHISFEQDKTEDQSGAGNHAMRREGYYSLPAAGAVAQNAAALTLSAWVKLKEDVKTFQDIMAFSIAGKVPNATSRASLRLMGNNQLVGFGRSLDQETAQEVKSIASIRKNEWHHVAAIINYRDSKIDLFIDGLPVPTEGKAVFHSRVTPDSPSMSAAIGAEDDGSAGQLQGEYQEVAAWRRALSAEEMKALYQLQKVHFP